jgi:hypothetical protein
MLNFDTAAVAMVEPGSLTGFLQAALGRYVHMPLEQLSHCGLHSGLRAPRDTSFRQSG